MQFCEHSVIIACNDSNYQKVHFLIVLRVKKSKKVAPHGGYPCGAFVFCGAYSPKLKVTARHFHADRVGQRPSIALFRKVLYHLLSI